jgi:predicted nucleotide-binding protein (sugar kinase/HSP70/actin superfamily)
MTRVAVPNFGNYTIGLAASVECLGAEPWCSMSTPETTRLGIEAAPESTCLPFKANLGHFLKAAQEGVEYAVMVNSVGTCRLRYYRDLQQKILERMNVRMHIFTLGYDGFKPPLIRHFDPSLRTVLAGMARAALKMKVVDILELQAWRTRALELRPGDTTQVMHGCLKELEEAKTVQEIRVLRRAISGRFRAIPVEEGREPLKVALVGEATVLRDKYLNHNVEDILGALGVQVYNFFLLGVEIKKIFHLEFSSRNSRRARLKIAHPYLKSLVGGHAIETISNTIYGAKDGYDGAIHIYPTGCMPEVSIKPILSKISQDYSLPILNCSFDEHTSHVGMVTRIETFVDLLYEGKKKAGSLTG